MDARSEPRAEHLADIGLDGQARAMPPPRVTRRSGRDHEGELDPTDGPVNG